MTGVSEIAIALGIFVAYLAAMRWVLPRFGFRG